MLTKPLGRLLTLCVGLFVVAVVWFVLEVNPLGSPGRAVIITVHSGDSISMIASQMHAKGVIGSPLAFRIDTLLSGFPVVQPGSYKIRQHSSFSAVKAIMSSRSVNVTPGLTLHEVAMLIVADKGNTFANSFVLDANAAAVQSPYHPNGSLEGLIGAGNYLISPRETPLQLLDKMTASFAKLATSVGLTPLTTVEGLNAYQLITGASIVEKEGYYPRYMPQVARVIFNRLQRGGPLQMDATVLYYLGLDGGTVTHAMLSTQTPYNTYLNTGLTPTPICTVSAFSLNAMLHAPPGPWLYFTVIDKSGTTAFSTTFAQQLANEKIAAARGLS